MPDKPLSARIEVFRPGTFTPMVGDPISYSAADLRAIADAYDPANAPAPVVVGHPRADAPAFGWIERLDYDAGAERLFATLHQIEPAFADMVKAGRFKRVSMQYFRPDQANNPVPGTWYPKHVGFLGAAAPAVSGLKPVAFAGEPGVTFVASFGDPALEDVAGLFQRLREWLIGDRGLDAADEALPSWRIDWLREQADKPAVPAFADGGRVPPTPTPEKEDFVVTKPDPAFAEREAAIAAREKALADRERQLALEDNASFAEGLVTEGRLLPASKDKLVALMGALGEAGEATVSFAEGGEKLAPVAALKAILSEQPKVVSFGEADLPEGGDTAPASFASAGNAVDPGRLAIHQKALAWQQAHPGTGYLDAVQAVS